MTPPDARIGLTPAVAYQMLVSWSTTGTISPVANLLAGAQGQGQWTVAVAVTVTVAVTVALAVAVADEAFDAEIAALANGDPTALDHLDAARGARRDWCPVPGLTTPARVELSALLICSGLGAGSVPKGQRSTDHWSGRIAKSSADEGKPPTEGLHDNGMSQKPSAATADGGGGEASL